MHRDELPSRMRDADHALSGPTRTSCLPKLAPFKRPMKAPGALSNPSVMYSLYFTLPAPTHGAHRAPHTGEIVIQRIFP